MLKNNRLFILAIVFLNTCLTFSGLVHADTIVLKSGRTIEGKIVEQTDSHIKVDFHGVSVKFYRDDIESMKLSPIPAPRPKSAAKATTEEVISSVKPAPVKPIAKGEHFLWQVQSKTTTIHIFGSIHLATPDLYPLDKAIEDAFGASDRLVVEINTAQYNPMALAAMFMEAGMYPPGDTLVKHVSAKTLKRTQKKFDKMGIDINRFMMFKPWFVAMNLVTMELLKLGFDSTYGVDNYFINKAKGRKKIVELETVEFQINLFNTLSDKVQDLLLFSTLVDLDILEKEFNIMFKLWKTGDVDGMEAMLRKGLTRYPQIRPFYDAVLYKRNKTMARKIETFLQTKRNYFVVVGAAHLVGKEGIIEILRKKGYQIRQL